MLKKLNIVILFFIILLICNCEKEILVQRIPTETPEFTDTPEVEKTLYSTASIQWSVNQPCTTSLKYWIPGENDTSQLSENEYRQNHSATIYGLIENTQYNYRVTCFNRYEYYVLSEILPFQTTVDYTGFVTAGWMNFEEIDYDSSIFYFTEYLDNVPLDFDALLGAGWSYCKINKADSAKKYFDRSLELNRDNDDATAGKALNSYKQSLFGQALTYSKIIHNKAINYWSNNWETYNPLDSAFYVFQHDSTFDNLDLALILADSYYKTLNYDDSKTVINFLYPNVKVHPYIPNSWEINSIKYENYEDALGALIDSLKSEYWINGQFPQ